MGEFYISGAAARDLVQIPADQRYLRRCRSMAALYAPMCRDDGGIVDDVIVYRLGFTTPHYLLVVNASNIAKDLAWVSETAAAPRHRRTMSRSTTAATPRR